jgi:hypothetical protein
MDKMPKSLKIAFVLYIVGLVGAFYFVQRTISQSNVEVRNKPEVKTTVEIHPAKVTLVVKVHAKSELVYTTTLTNQDSVNDLFEEYRKTGAFTYQKTSYVSGLKLDSVNGYPADGTMRWAIFENDVEILDFSEYHLSDGKTYTISLVSKS